MLQYINNLSDSEKENIILAPIWVSALIASADGTIDKEELDRAMEVIHIKSYSEKEDIKDVFAETDKIAENVIRKLIVNLPSDNDKKIATLTEKLEGLNDIFAKLDVDLANKYIKSLKRLAYYVASASGGILGFNSVSESEKALIGLPMINEITK